MATSAEDIVADAEPFRVLQEHWSVRMLVRMLGFASTVSEREQQTDGHSEHVRLPVGAQLRARLVNLRLSLIDQQHSPDVSVHRRLSLKNWPYYPKVSSG